MEAFNNIVNYLEIVARRKWVLIIPVALCTVLGLIMAFSLPVYYRSTTLILVEQQQVPEEYVKPTNKVPFGQRLNSIRQQIMSRSRLEQIISDFGLYRDSGHSIVVQTLNKMGMGVGPASGKEEAVARMSEDIDIRVMGEKKGSEDAFSISYSYTDPYVAMQVTNKLASFFIEESLKSREQYAEGTSDFLEEELANAKQELENQERAGRQYKERFMGSLPQQLEANLRTLDRLQLDLQAVRLDLKSAEDRKNLFENQLKSGSPLEEKDSLRSELQALEKDLAIQLSMYKENYPDVILTKNRINEIRGLLAKQGSGTARQDNSGQNFNEKLMLVSSQFSSLKQREADLRAQIKSFERRVEETPANEQRFLDLRRDYDITLNNYQNLLEKKLNAKLAENLEKRQKGERFKILDPANLPERPFKLNKLKVVFGGLFAGVAIGAGLIFLLELLNPAFRKSEECAGLLPMPVLAAIPILYVNEKKSAAGRFRTLQRKFTGYGNIKAVQK